MDVTLRRPPRVARLDIFALALAVAGSIVLLGVGFSWWMLPPVVLALGPLVAPQPPARILFLGLMVLWCAVFFLADGIGLLWTPALITMIVAAARRRQ